MQISNGIPSISHRKSKPSEAFRASKSFRDELLEEHGAHDHQAGDEHRGHGSDAEVMTQRHAQQGVHEADGEQANHSPQAS